VSASERTRSLTRAAATLLVVAAGYEATARSGLFSPSLLPTLPAIARALV
jgi:ABC-type nitrate/sulfonate/bicarbonate transport system permease component